MKPLFHKVPTSIQSSFGIKHDIEPSFGKIWHYHPELELHYVVRGEGVRFIGDNVSNFSSGEIILLGENLPHTFSCSEEYNFNANELEVETIVIQFLPDCLGREIFNLPEACLIPKLFEKAKKGMVISGATRDQLATLMKKATVASQMEKLILFLSILHLLAETSEYEPITSALTSCRSNESDTVRLNKIYSYTLTNYKKEISLEEISSISQLSITSFCRYFKLMTRKTYYDFLIEIRISHACRLLVEDKVPTETICFDCGFNNVSNFYRHFKKIAGMTPMDYKRKYLLN